VLKKRWHVYLCVMVCLSMSFAFAMPAKAKISADEIEKLLKPLGISSVQVLGIEPSPIKGLWIVYANMENNKKGAFIISEKGDYIITGKLLSLKDGGKDIILETGVMKGYFPLPKSRKVNIKIDTHGSPSFGSATAPQVVVYLDPLCPYCLKEIRGLIPMIKEGEIHLVLKYFIVHGDRARDIAKKSLCVYQKEGSGRFWEFLLSKEKGLDNVKQNCDESKMEFLLTRDEEEANKMDLKGTPASIINGRLYVGYLGRATLEKLLLTVPEPADRKKQ